MEPRLHLKPQQSASLNGEFMPKEPTEWNRYMLRALPRHERARIILRDVRNELDFTKDCTNIALESDALDKPKDFDTEDDDFNF